MRRDRGRTASLQIAFACFVTAGAAAQDLTVQPLWVAGGTGQSIGDFGVPESAAIDSLGRVVVTDKGRMMLHVYDAATGRALFDVGGLGAGPGEFDRPNGIAVDARGRVLVVEQRNTRVQILDREYKPAGTFGRAGGGDGGFTKAMGIALDPAGRIYITDEARRNVQAFDAGGKFLFEFDRDPRLKKVESIEIDTPRQRVFVCDEGRSRVNVYDLKGRYQESFGSRGAGPGEFGDDPNAVRIDGQGRIYINDQGNQRLNVYSPSFEFVAAIHNAKGGFESADGVALSERHNLLVVCDQGHDRVVAFDLRAIQKELAALEAKRPPAPK